MCSWRRRTAPIVLAALVTAACLSVCPGGPFDSAAQAAPRCFGAASRDHLHPCRNRALSFIAIPTPEHALLEENPPCAQIRFDPGVCALGLSRAKAAKTVAVIGDSHAAHWRPALSVVAARRGWRVLSIARPNCPFTFARSRGPGMCLGWARSVGRYLVAHPEVHTVFVSANSGSGVVAAGGRSRRATKIDGFIRAWAALPPSVAEVFVIHDVPHNGRSATPCINRALKRHRNAGVRCARRRSLALRIDYQAVAADQSGSRRVKVIDLTPFMCSKRKCFPVVGGALVIKDIGHITRTFSRTLGPYLSRAVTRLRAGGSGR